jgi:hypothetical protein
MFKASVAQNAMTPVKAGKNTARNSLVDVNLEGVDKMGPHPPEFV